MFKKNKVGVNMVTPIILLELKKQQDNGRLIPIEESWVLLNETQAVYIYINSRENNDYYENLKKNIQELLKKYELSFVLEIEKLNEYVENFLSEKEVKKNTTLIVNELEKTESKTEFYYFSKNVKLKNIAEIQLMRQIFSID